MTTATPEAPQEAAPETPAPAPVAETPAPETGPEESGDIRSQAHAAFAKAWASVPEAKPEEAPPGDDEPTQPGTPPAAEAAPPAAPAELEKPTETPPSPEAQKLARNFEALALEARRIQQQREELKAERAEYEAYRKAKAEAKANPLQALKSLGLEYEEVVDHILSNGKPDPVKEVRAQVEALRAENERQKQEAAAAREAQAISGFKSQMRQTLKAKADTYEFAALKSDAAVDLAYQAVDAYYQAHGELPGGSAEAAIEAALQHVESVYEADAVAYSTAKKLQAKVSALGATRPAEAPRAQASQPTQSQPKPKTLTNSQAAVAPTRREPDNLSVEELRARAARILAGDTA